MKISRLNLLSLLLFFLLPRTLSGQPVPAILYPFTQNPPYYAVPFLSFTPDARAGSLGDAGVATSPDINSQHWNPAKYAFMEGSAGVALSYTPWMRRVVSDLNLFYAAGFYRIDHRQFISSSVRYIDLGEIFLITPAGSPFVSYRPADLAVDMAYSRKMSDQWSMALALRYIRSDLKKVSALGFTSSELATSLAGDLAFYHLRNIILFNKDSRLAFGINLSNMGSKMAYSEKTPGAFIPANMRLGGALTVPLGQQNSLSLMTDLNKLMVPTPAQPECDTVGTTIFYGKDTDVPVLQGMIRSFWDAPGVVKDNGKRSVLLEELHEITCSFGLEYWYKHLLALRTGYFNEHETKGNRKYFTIGAGLQLNYLGLDCNYILPVYHNSHFVNTFRLTVTVLLNDNVNTGKKL